MQLKIKKIRMQSTRAAPDETVLKEAVRRIVEIADPDQIVLFGSAARGQVRPNSDLDLLVIKSGKYKRGDLTGKIYINMHGFGHPVDIIVATPDEIARYRDSYCLVYYPAVREGRVVYKKEKEASASDGTNAPRVAEEEPPTREQRFSPDDPRAWLRYARSDLALARAEAPEIYLEHLCFHAQQAVEKALKAVLIMRGVRFPYTHDIADLATNLEQSGLLVPDHVKAAEALSRFATETRYPGFEGKVTPEEYQQSIALAEAVVRWAELLIARA